MTSLYLQILLNKTFFVSASRPSQFHLPVEIWNFDGKSKIQSLVCSSGSGDTLLYSDRFIDSRAG